MNLSSTDHVEVAAEHPVTTGVDSWVLLAPEGAEPPPGLGPACTLPAAHGNLLSALQAFRGKVYVEDGAVKAHELTPSGRHVCRFDDRAWHLVCIAPDGQVVGCKRMLIHGHKANFDDLAVRDSVIKQPKPWRDRAIEAISLEMELARREGRMFIEAGGWALAERLRYGSPALRTTLTAYALAELSGGCRSVGMATRRHCSNVILKRIGGKSLELHGEVIEPYFDNHYGCEMELLRFDSQQVNPRYMAKLRDVMRQLGETPVLLNTRANKDWASVFQFMPSSFLPGPVLEFAH